MSHQDAFPAISGYVVGVSSVLDRLEQGGIHPSAPEQWCSFYRRCDLPAVLLRDAVVMPLGRVAALHMPESLGFQVFAWLRSQMIGVPLLVRPIRGRGERWTFLTARNIQPKLATLSALNRAGAGMCVQDTVLTLPLSWQPVSGSSWWVSAPAAGRDLPLLSAVICGTKTIVAQQRAFRS